MAQRSTVRLLIALLAVAQVFAPQPAAATPAPPVRPAAPVSKPLAAPKTWTGAGADNKFSTPQNWSGNVAPAVGDSLVFPTGVAKKTADNDLGAGLLNTFQIASVTIEDTGYTISGDGLAPSGDYLVNAGVRVTMTLGSLFTGAGSHQIGVAAGGTLVHQGSIAGNDGLVVYGGGTVEIAGANDNSNLSGKITVLNATLNLNKPNGKKAFSGPLVVGDQALAPDLSKVVYRDSNQIPDDITVTVNKSGRLDLNGFSESLGPIVMTGGAIDTLGTNIGAFGLLTPTAGIVITNSVSTASISGTVAVPGYGLTIAAGTNAPGGTPGLQIAALIQDGDGPGTIKKTGPGTVVFSGNNTFTGLIDIQGGVLDAGHIKALGNAGEHPGLQIGPAGTIKFSAPVSATRFFTVQNGGPTPAIVSTSAPTLNAYLSLSGTVIISVAQSSVLTVAGSVGHGPPHSGVRKQGAGALVYSGEGYGVFQLQKPYTYTIESGVMRAAGSSGKLMGFFGFDVKAGAALEVDATYLNIRGLYGAGEVRLLGPTATFQVSTFAGESALFTGVITGEGTFQGLGYGLQTLTGNNAIAQKLTWFAGDLTIANATGTGFKPASMLWTGQPSTMTVANTGGVGIDTFVINVGGCGKLLVNNTGGIGIIAENSVLTFQCSTIGGSGVISSYVGVGGNLVPGNNGPGTLRVNRLAMSPVATTTFELGGLAGPNDLIEVDKELGLDGNVVITALPGFGPGTYRLFNYGTFLVNNGLEILSAPSGYLYAIDTATPGQVNLRVAQGTSTGGGGLVVVLPGVAKEYAGGW